MELRYGENPHQTAGYYGNLEALFTQLHGKALSYNNLVDVDAAVQLIGEFEPTTFAIIKHTNVCGIASRPRLTECWQAALAGDPESAFGGVLVTNAVIDEPTAKAIHEIFFEVLIAPGFAPEAFQLLAAKKNRILLQQKHSFQEEHQYKSLLGGTLVQETDRTNFSEWEEVGGRKASAAEKEDLSRIMG